MGPTAVGSIKRSDSTDTLKAIAAAYLSAFNQNAKTYPYLVGLIVPDDKPYSTQLQAGLGLSTATKTLLDLWSPGMSANQLHQVALESGRSDRRRADFLNIVVECFPTLFGFRRRAGGTSSDVRNNFHGRPYAAHAGFTSRA